LVDELVLPHALWTNRILIGAAEPNGTASYQPGQHQEIRSTRLAMKGRNINAAGADRRPWARRLVGLLRQR
jgi:hypothetical protein